MRLDRILANSGYGSRSQVRDLIRAGHVCFQGEPVNDPSLSIKEDQESLIIFDGNPIVTSRYLYIALHKPSGYLTALEDKRLPTVADLVPLELINKGLAPVGRLDYNTTGMLLLTNNGVLAHRLMSPKWHIEKTYHVTYSGDPLTDETVTLFGSGMTLCETGLKTVKLACAKLELREKNTCRLTITQGKTHQVKRMIAAVGRSVTALHRESVCGITLTYGPESGSFRNLTASEVDLLYSAAKMTGMPK